MQTHRTSHVARSKTASSLQHSFDTGFRNGQRASSTVFLLVGALVIVLVAVAGLKLVLALVRGASGDAMKSLGTIFVCVGIVLCMTILFFVPGLLAVGVGALLRMAAGRNAPAEHATRF